MKHIDVDVAIIGAGTAGLVAYRTAKSAGVSALIIEGGELGTTCARVGCMPSKLLIAAAEAVYVIRKAPGFGIHIDGHLDINGHEVMERVRRERDRFVSLMVRDIMAFPEADRILGWARFMSDYVLLIDNHTQITAKSIVIATGSHAAPVEASMAFGGRVIASDNVFDWQDLPKAVAVIGTGSVGLELGQALHNLGVKTVVLGRGGRVGPLSDPDVSDYTGALLNEDFTVEPDSHILSIQADKDQVIVRRGGLGNAIITDHFDYVLAATGRVPNVSGLGLERTTLKLNAKGVPLFDPGTTRATDKDGESAIFIAGDVDSVLPLQHEAVDEGRIAGGNAARAASGKKIEPGRRRAALSIVFTEPQIAIVGGGFRSLKPGSFVIGQASFEDQGRARIMLKNQGLLNVYAENFSGKLLGAEMLAPGAEHLAHLLAWALQQNMTVAQMLEMPFYHPGLEEGLRSALKDANTQVKAAQQKPDRVLQPS